LESLIGNTSDIIQHGKATMTILAITGEL